MADRRIRLKQINPETATTPKFVLGTAGSLLDVTNVFTAASVPFVPSGGMISTQVNAAIVEAYSAAVSGTFTNPLLVDLQMGNTFSVKAQNGTGLLNLRNANVNDRVALKGGPAGAYSFNISNTFLGISDDTEAYSSNYFKITPASLVELRSASTVPLLVSNNGKFGLRATPTSKLIEILGQYNSVTISPFLAADNFSASYTTANLAQPVSGVSAQQVTFNSGVSNSVALGGTTYTVATSNAAYAQKFALVNSGFETILVSATLAGNHTITFPAVTGTLPVLSGVIATNRLAYYDSGTGLITSGIIRDSGTTAAINSVVSALDTFQITTGASETAALRILGTNASGGQYGTNIALSGAATTNYAIYLSATGAVSTNYALYAVAGFGYFAQNFAVGSGTPTVGNTVRINTLSTDTKGLLINNTNAVSTQYGANIVLSGGAVTNKGIFLDVSNATTNYALHAANGQVEITNGSLLVQNGNMAIGNLAAVDSVVGLNIASDAQNTILHALNSSTTASSAYGVIAESTGVGGAHKYALTATASGGTTDNIAITATASGTAAMAILTSGSVSVQSGTLGIGTAPVVAASINVSITQASDTPYGGFNATVTGAFDAAVGGAAVAVSGSNTSNIGYKATVTGTNATAFWAASGALLIGASSNVVGTSVLAQFDSTTKGVVFPRLLKADVTTPVAGMVVFDTGTTKLVCYDGSAWQDLF